MTEQIHEREDDLLSKAMYSWTIRAGRPEDAIIEALEKATGVPAFMFRDKIEIQRLDYTLYLVQDRKAKTSIVARVVERPRSPVEEMQALLTGGRTLHEKEYWVTFYPRTYRRGSEPRII